MKRFVAIIFSLLMVSLPITFALELHLSYDANGNLVTGDGKYRVYNSLNQLSAIYNGTSTSDPLLETYVYHPTEERIWYKQAYYSNGSVQETTYYENENYVRVVNASGSYDVRYVKHGGQFVAQQNADGSKLYIHGNHEGSSSVITNSTGGVVERTEYAPFGEKLNSSTIRYGYEGKEADSLVEDTDFNARKYRPDLGIFSQPDDKIQHIYNPQNLNRYSFELNNPYSFIDETGHFNVRLFGLGMAGAALGGLLLYGGVYGFMLGHVDIVLGATLMAVSTSLPNDDATAEKYAHYFDQGPMMKSIVLTKDVVIDKEEPQDLIFFGPYDSLFSNIVERNSANDAGTINPSMQTQGAFQTSSKMIVLTHRRVDDGSNVALTFKIRNHQIEGGFIGNIEMSPGFAAKAAQAVSEEGGSGGGGGIPTPHPKHPPPPWCTACPK